MPRFERSREKRNGRRDSRPPRDSGRNDGPRRFSDRRDSGRSDGRGRPKMTKVTCSSCNSECEVPFKPTSSKPVFCSDCFSKKGGSKRGGQDLSEINEKLDKIMKALKIY